MTDIGTIENLWRESLKAEAFELDRLQALFFEYKRACRRRENWNRIYREQREIYLQELRAVREDRKRELLLLSKKDLCERLKIPWPSDRTKEDIIEWNLFGVQPENEHERVKKIWESMTEEERER